MPVFRQVPGVAAGAGRGARAGGACGVRPVRGGPSPARRTARSHTRPAAVRRNGCRGGRFPAGPPHRCFRTRVASGWPASGSVSWLGRRLGPTPQPPPPHPTPPVTPSPPRLPLCRTSKFHPRFCTHTAHDGPPVRSDSLSGVISAIARGGSVAPALRPASTDDIRDRAAVAGLRGREGGARASGTSCTPRARTSQRAASHPLGSSKLAHISPLISPRGIASKQTGHPASRRYTGGEETVLPSTSRNGARQEPEDNADQAGRSQGRAAREGRPGS